MDRRAAFFLVASAAGFALTPVADAEHRWVSIGVGIVYAVLALASFLDHRSRQRAGLTTGARGDTAPTDEFAEALTSYWHTRDPRRTAVPTPDAYAPGQPCWIDLLTPDTDRARAFYGDLFGWTAEEAGPEYGGYINFSKDGKQVGGCMGNDDPSMGTFWTVYLKADDTAATVAAAEKKGGTVFLPAQEVMELGTMAMVGDPGGAGVGIWQPKDHKGFGLVAETGAASWFELHTRNYGPAVEFYKDVFGWDAHTVSDTPDFRYTTLFEGEAQAAGIMDDSVMPDDGTPPHWAVYFGVENADKTIEQAVAMGGTLVQGPDDTPYGRLAVVTDPMGAAFRLVQN